MIVRSDLPVPVRVVEHTWIPARDGTRLSARVWIPDAGGDPRPAIVEAHPYRASDMFATGDARTFGYLAGHGYACVRVDVRGSGNSEGVLTDEYLPLEQEDNEDILAWVAAQEWCDGSVGWIGLSWSGFAGLQLAARRPASLRALIAMCASDDRYSDDVHYSGGCVLAEDMVSWATTMAMLNALPPDPDVVGQEWRAMWTARLQGSPPFIEHWLSHQLQDDYWRQGSVGLTPGAITIPVLAVGGWSDGYASAPFRLAAQLGSSCEVLVGPWSHGWPHSTLPGPAIGFLQECVAFFDRTLKEHHPAAPPSPVRAYLQDWDDPAPWYGERTGRWIGLPAIPHQTRELSFGRGGTLEAQPQGVGIDAGAWCPSGGPGQWPGDQAPIDAASLTFDTERLEEPLEVLGIPVAGLHVSSGRPAANIVVRLCDVAPDGRSLLVSRGVLDLTHRFGHEGCVALEPGVAEPVSVVLRACGHRFGAGHHIRLSIGTSYFPWIWPQAAEATLTVDSPSVVLPVSGGGTDLEEAFGDPETAHAASPVRITGGRYERRAVSEGSTHTLTEEQDGGVLRMASGIELRTATTTECSIDDDDPLSARVDCAASGHLERDEWRVEVSVNADMTARPDAFLVHHRLVARLDGGVVHETARSLTIPRVLPLRVTPSQGES